MASNVVLTHTVHDAQGRNIAGARVVVKNAQGQVLADVYTDYSGTAVIDWLTPGSYTVQTQQTGWAVTTNSINLAAGANNSSATLTPLAIAQSTTAVVLRQIGFAAPIGSRHRCDRRGQ